MAARGADRARGAERPLRRWEGRVLVAAYVLVVLGFLLAGDR